MDKMMRWETHLLSEPCQQQIQAGTGLASKPGQQAGSAQVIQP